VHERERESKSESHGERERETQKERDCIRVHVYRYIYSGKCDLRSANKSGGTQHLRQNRGFFPQKYRCNVCTHLVLPCVAACCSGGKKKPRQHRGCFPQRYLYCNVWEHSYTALNCFEKLRQGHLGSATHCNTLQRTAAHYSILQHTGTNWNTLEHTAAALQNTGLASAWDAVCSGCVAGVLQRVAVCFECVEVCCSVIQCGAVRCSAFQCVAVCTNLRRQEIVWQR